MQTQKILRSPYRKLVVLLALNASLARGEERHLGSGIAYPGQNEAIYVNPTGLAEGGKASLLGAYLPDPKAIEANIAGTYGMAGLGASFIKADSVNYFSGGFGANLGMALFGVTLRGDSKGSDLDGDIGVAIEAPSFRIAGVARGLNGGLDRLDGGLGIKLGMATVEGDIKKPWPAGSDAWLFDSGISVAVDQFSVAVGYDFSRMAGKFQSGHIHAGLDFKFSQNLAMQVNYRHMPQEPYVYSKWSFGLRYTF